MRSAPILPRDEVLIADLVPAVSIPEPVADLALGQLVVHEGETILHMEALLFVLEAHSVLELGSHNAAQSATYTLCCIG